LALAARAGLEKELLLLDAGVHNVLHAHIHLKFSVTKSLIHAVVAEVYDVNDLEIVKFQT
jgi:hypothetical protein